MKKILYLHCGTHKTGTTTIQHYLNDNKSLLEKNNLIYPSIAKTKKIFYNHHGIAWSISDDPRIKYEQNKDFLNDFFKFFKDSEKNLVISSEDFQFYNIGKNSYSKFCEELDKANYKIKPIIYLRNQIDFFKGIYQILLMLGVQFLDCEHALNIIKEKNNRLELKENKLTFLFNYFELIENIKEKLNVTDNDIICKSYDENRENLIKSFNNIIGINDDIELNSHKNIGLPKLVIELLETLNKNIKRSNIDLKTAANARKNILFNEIYRLGENFKIDNKNIKIFFKNEFYHSNSLVEKIYNIEINKFLI